MRRCISEAVQEGGAYPQFHFTAYFNEMVLESQLPHKIVNLLF